MLYLPKYSTCTTGISFWIFLYKWGCEIQKGLRHADKQRRDKVKLHLHCIWYARCRHSRGNALPVVVFGTLGRCAWWDFFIEKSLWDKVWICLKSRKWTFVSNGIVLVQDGDDENSWKFSLYLSFERSNWFSLVMMWRGTWNARGNSKIAFRK